MKSIGFPARGTETNDGDCVRLTVQDTGVGITKQEMERLFDAFYTTKSDGMGMGFESMLDSSAAAISVRQMGINK